MESDDTGVDGYVSPILKSCQHDKHDRYLICMVLIWAAAFHFKPKHNHCLSFVAIPLLLLWDCYSFAKVSYIFHMCFGTGMGLPHSIILHDPEPQVYSMGFLLVL